MTALINVLLHIHNVGQVLTGLKEVSLKKKKKALSAIFNEAAFNYFLEHFPLLPKTSFPTFPKSTKKSEAAIRSCSGV